MQQHGDGGGLVQITGSDNLIITPIQLTMTISLGKIYNVTLRENIAKEALASAIAAVVGLLVFHLLIVWSPGVRNMINATNAARLTETGCNLPAKFVKQTND